jgi:hypothetical protein
MAISREVDDEIKRNPPSESTRRSFSFSVSVLGFNVKSHGMVTKPMKHCRRRAFVSWKTKNLLENEKWV